MSIKVAKLKLKRMGLNYPTEVEYNGDTCITVGISIADTVKAWRKRFKLEGYAIELYANSEDYRNLNSRVIPQNNSLAEVLQSNGVMLMKDRNEKEIKEMTEVLQGCIVQDSCDYVCFEESAENLINAGCRICGGDSCQNFKHYKAECARCNKVVENRHKMQLEEAELYTRRKVAKEIIEDMIRQNWAGNFYFIERYARELADKYGIKVDG